MPPSRLIIAAQVTHCARKLLEASASSLGIGVLQAHPNHPRRDSEPEGGCGWRQPHGIARPMGDEIPRLAAGGRLEMQREAAVPGVKREGNARGRRAGRRGHRQRPNEGERAQKPQRGLSLSHGVGKRCAKFTDAHDCRPFRGVAGPRAARRTLAHDVSRKKIARDREPLGPSWRLELAVPPGNGLADVDVAPSSLRLGDSVVPVQR